MEQQYVNLLRSRRAETKAAWERLLRLEKEVSPLAKPDLLVRLIDPSLECLFSLLEGPALSYVPTRHLADYCPCGRNPLVAFYTVGRQAVREAFVWAESDLLEDTMLHRDVAHTHLEAAFEILAKEEILAFCSLCRFRARRRRIHQSASNFRGKNSIPVP